MRRQAVEVQKWLDEERLKGCFGLSVITAISKLSIITEIKKPSGSFSNYAGNEYDFDLILSNENDESDIWPDNMCDFITVGTHRNNGNSF